MKTKEEWNGQIQQLGDKVEHNLEVIKQIQLNAMKEGVSRYAWWKDGIMYVGSYGKTLKKAIEELEKEFQ